MQCVVCLQAPILHNPTLSKFTCRAMSPLVWLEVCVLPFTMAEASTCEEVPAATVIGLGAPDLDDDLQDIMPDPEVMYLADLVAGMEPRDPNIMRATQAGNVLRACGRPVKWISQDLYSKSIPVTVIQDFWSHSWHGSNFLKRLLLLLLYNGPAAMIASTLIALLPAVWHSLGILTGVERETRTRFEQGEELVFGPWCTVTAGVSFAVVLCTFRSRRMVFFDQICIHQYDAKLKFEGIISIGAFLKHSEHFLLIWDATFTQRLWCVLELAGFLTSHPDAEANVRIRPTAIAPCIFSVGLATWFSMLHWILFLDAQPVIDMLILSGARIVSFWIVSAYLRSHYRDTEIMLQQLSSFTVKGAACHCCTHGHERADGSRIICDRDVICQCIRIWYGSVEAFETAVRTRVKVMLHRQLGGLLFPYGWQLVGTAPFLWGFADLTAARTRARSWSAAGLTIWCGFTWWLVLGPLIFLMTLLLAKYFRRRPESAWQDQLKNGAVALLVTALSFLGNWTSLLVYDFLSACLWVASVVLLSGTCWWVVGRYEARQLEPQPDLDPGTIMPQ